MNDPRKQERRRRKLKERRAADARNFEQVEAWHLFGAAVEMRKSGDDAGAARAAKKALHLDASLFPALELLAQIYRAAGQREQAIAYLQQLREFPEAPVANYQLGMLYLELGRREEAVRYFQDFLEATRSGTEPTWNQLRKNARELCARLSPRGTMRAESRAPSRGGAAGREAGEKARPSGRAAGERVQPSGGAGAVPAAGERVPPGREAAAAQAAGERVQPGRGAATGRGAGEKAQPSRAGAADAAGENAQPSRQVPRVAVDYVIAPVPAGAAAGTLADYLLRRRLLELRLAQSFEDLVCVPSLHGVDTYQYQQETVRRVLRHFKGRALLADEVGLGKTIEACLVLKEYWARGMVRKALVLTPPSLVSQWQGELAEKFGLAPVTPDDAAFRADPARFWGEQPLVVASIAMARLEPHASMLAGVGWDLVIVDEAHCLKNRSSANWKLINSLTKKFILMLTATPVENNLLELYSLITVLKPGLLATESEFRKQFLLPGKPKSPRNAERLRELLAEVMVRNTRSVVDVRLPHRVAASVTVLPSPEEAKLYTMVSSYVAARYEAAKPGSTLGLQLLQRQAGSSAPALARATGRMLAENERLSAADRRELEAIQEAASQVPWTGKGMQLGGMLAEHESKVVVFTEFTATLQHLEEICERHSVRYAVFSGEMTKGEKDRAIARFREEANVLLSTGSGGEGRNLQFANTVINFDLPWNPMRLEQRVGRVHRIGQTQEVFVFNFCQAETVEEQLLRVLHDKINMFELVVGEMDAILGTLDEGDFAGLVLELWLSGRGAGQIERGFDDLADRLLAAKKEYAEAKRLDEALFQRDFEV